MEVRGNRQEKKKKRTSACRKKNSSQVWEIALHWYFKILFLVKKSDYVVYVLINQSSWRVTVSNRSEFVLYSSNMLNKPCLPLSVEEIRNDLWKGFKEKCEVNLCLSFYFDEILVYAGDNSLEHMTKKIWVVHFL